MSGWDAWTGQMVQNENVQAAGFYGLDNGVQWSATAGLSVTAAEAMALVNRFKEPNSGAALMASGEKYMALNCTTDTLRGKSGSTKNFLLCACSDKVLIVVVCPADKTAGVAGNVLENMVGSLKASGF